MLYDEYKMPKTTGPNTATTTTATRRAASTLLLLLLLLLRARAALVPLLLLLPLLLYCGSLARQQTKVWPPDEYSTPQVFGGK